MSLIAFHRVLILAAIAFCLAFAGWELQAYRTTDAGAGTIVIAAVFAVLALLLTVYLARLRSILHIRD